MLTRLLKPSVNDKPKAKALVNRPRIVGRVQERMVYSEVILARRKGAKEESRASNLA